MSTVFSAGYQRGCYYEVLKEHKDVVKATVETPITKREHICSSYEAARKWVDGEMVKYEKFIGLID